MSKIILRKGDKVIAVNSRIEADLFVEHYGWALKVDATVVKEKATKAVKEA